MSKANKVGRRKSEEKIGERIIDLRKKGRSYNEISAILDCSKGTISYHSKKVGLNNPVGYEKNHKRLSKTEQDKIKTYTKENPGNIPQASRDLGYSRPTIEKYRYLEKEE